MDLREDPRAEGPQDLFHPAEHLPDVGFHKKTVGPGTLGGKSKRVQPDGLCAMPRQAREVLFHKAPSHSAFQVDVQLFLAKGAPQLLGGAVREADRHMRRPGLSLVDHCQLFRRRLAARPEFSPAYEQIPPERSVFILQIVLAIGALAGDVVDHKITHQIITGRQFFHVIPAAEGRVRPIIAQRCESPVA